MEYSTWNGCDVADTFSGVPTFDIQTMSVVLAHEMETGCNGERGIPAWCATLERGCCQLCRESPIPPMRRTYGPRSGVLLFLRLGLVALLLLFDFPYVEITLVMSYVVRNSTHGVCLRVVSHARRVDHLRTIRGVRTRSVRCTRELDTHFSIRRI